MGGPAETAMLVSEPVPRRSTARAVAVLLVALLLAAVVPVAGPATAATTWTKNLFVSKAFLYQDPYYTACTAASVMHMLNTVAYRRTGGYGFRWTPTRIKRDDDPGNYRDMTSILAFERRYDTLRSTSAGSDAHGWRNALNYYGWGRAAMEDPAKRVYEDRAYTSFGGAMKAAVRAMARHNMPVGVLAWAGGHAQVLTGYVVTGADPRVSSDFTIHSVYLSDPLRESGILNRRTSYTSMKEGALRLRFQWYREIDSPYDDPYTSGWIRSSVKPTIARSEWYHRWVLLVPVRPGMPAPTAPTPTPTPTPSPTPSPDPTPSTPPTEAPTVQPAPGGEQAPDEDAGGSATAPPQPTVTPAPEPTPDPTPDPTGTPPPTPTAPPTPAPTDELASEASGSQAPSPDGPTTAPAP